MSEAMLFHLWVGESVAILLASTIYAGVRGDTEYILLGAYICVVWPVCLVVGIVAAPFAAVYLLARHVAHRRTRIERDYAETVKLIHE